ncbi:hypothetical protein [Comamonas sp.]|uniref:hypothetical protein n=1 Tax=Comamonas sp. TaxID=34028 RepID=UPI0028AF317A|nr:hypothetical protein [Comamonas sp.]
MGSAAKDAMAPIAVPFTGGVIDLSKGSYFAGTVAGATAFTFNNRPPGLMVFQVEIKHTSGVITWPGNMTWPDGFAPVLKTGKRHRFMFEFVQSEAGTWWDGSCLPNY